MQPRRAPATGGDVPPEHGSQGRARPRRGHRPRWPALAATAVLLLSACDTAASDTEAAPAADLPAATSPSPAAGPDGQATPGAAAPDDAVPASGSAEDLVRRFFTAAGAGQRDQLDQLFTADPVVVDGPAGGRRMTSVDEIAAWVDDIATVNGSFTITRVLRSEPSTVRFEHTYRDDAYTGDDSGSATVSDGRISELEITAGQ